MPSEWWISPQMCPMPTYTLVIYIGAYNIIRIQVIMLWLPFSTQQDLKMLLSFSGKEIDGIVQSYSKIAKQGKTAKINGLALATPSIRSQLVMTVFLSPRDKFETVLYMTFMYILLEIYLMRRKTKTTNMKSINYKSYDKTNDTFRFDSLDINIIKELLTNSNIRTADIAARYKIPLSTIQRRRARIENSILEKKYHLDIKKGDWRSGMILANVREGRAKEVAKMILERYKDNTISSSTRINDQNNVIAEVIYNDPSDLHSIIEQIKGNPYVTTVTWSELVEVIGGSNAPLIRALSK